MNGSDKSKMIISNKLKKKLNKLYCLLMSLTMSKTSLMNRNKKINRLRFKINSKILRTMKWTSLMMNLDKIWQAKISN